MAQDFKLIEGDGLVSDDWQKLNENFKSIASNFSGTEFPTENLQVGMTCYRTDEMTEYRYNGSGWEEVVSLAGTVGNGTTMIYLDDGELKASTSTVGSSTKPVYLDSGVVTASSSTVGSGTKPVYMDSGTITVSGSTVGSSTSPVYMNGGTITECGTIANATTATKVGSSTVGGTSKPVYINSGTPTAISDTVGGTAKPVYLNGGTITAISSTVGSTVAPVYLNGGTITKCTMWEAGNNFSVLPYIKGDGVMEIGKYIDFHDSASSTDDYSTRITSNSGTLTLGSMTVGGSTRPIYFKSGTVTACTQCMSLSNNCDCGADSDG